MSGGDRGALTQKIYFVVLTFGISSALVFSMALSAGETPESQPHKETAPQAAAAPDHVVPAQRSERDLSIPPAPRATPDPALYLPNIADIAEKANGAVVNIRATEIIRSSNKARASAAHTTRSSS